MSRTAFVAVTEKQLPFRLHRLILTGPPLSAKIQAFAGIQWRHLYLRAFVEHPRPMAGETRAQRAGGGATPCAS